MSRSRILIVAVCLCVLAALVPAQLAGTFTINALAPTGAGNYASFGAAVADLITQGVAGPCVFEVFDDGGAFTEANPFVTSNVQWVPSTAVIVLGTWTGASIVNKVTFRAAPGESPVIDATGQSFGVFWNGADYVTIEGMEIMNALQDGVSLYSETQHGQALQAVIRRCRIHDCASTGVTIYGNSQYPDGTLIENNFFWNLQTLNGGGFSTTSRFGYISSRRDLNTTVLNNTFYVNAATGSAFCVMGVNPGGNETAWTIAGNVIVKTANAAQPIYSWPALLPVVADYNCYWDTSGGPFAAGTAVAANLPSWQTASGLDLTSIAADPLLINPAGGDLHIPSGSPCEDAIMTPSYVPDDIDGELRTGTPDIGADEIGTPSGLTNLGPGCPAATGLVPMLTATQPPVIGNFAFALELSQLPSNQLFLLFGTIGTPPPPTMIAPGCFLYMDVPQLINLLALGVLPIGPIPADVTGAATLPLPLPNDPALVGTEFVWQAGFGDIVPAGVALTNGFSMVVQ